MKAVPVLVPCPTCKLPIQQGDGPLGVAWHDCDWILDRERDAPAIPVPASFDEAERELISVVMSKARDTAVTPSEIAKMISALAELRGSNGQAKGGGGQGGEGSAIGDWVSRR